MKKLPHLFTVALAVAALTLPGCATAPTVTSSSSGPGATPSAVQKALMTGDQIVQAISSLPAGFKADVSNVIAKSPTTATDLNVLATGIETLATDAEAVPLPATLQNTAWSWVEMVPGKIGKVATGVAAAYQTAYPLLKKIPNVVTAVGEFIRTFEPPQPAATLTTALARHLHGARRLAYAVLRRRDGTLP